MAANSKAFVMVGEQALSCSTSASASGSIRESVLTAGEARLARAIMIVAVLLVFAVGIDAGMNFGVVWGLAAAGGVLSAILATIGLCAFVTGRPHDGV